MMQSTRSEGESTVNYRLVVSLSLATLVFVFIVQNVETVQVRFLFWTVALSRSLLIFFSLAAGMVIGWLLCSWRRHRRGRSGP